MSGLRDILEARHNVHGEFSDNSRIAQAFKEVMRGSPGWDGLDAPKKEALEMIASKIARALSGDSSYLDHWIDIAGYAQLAHDRITPKPPQATGVLLCDGVVRRAPKAF